MLLACVAAADASEVVLVSLAELEAAAAAMEALLLLGLLPVAVWVEDVLVSVPRSRLLAEVSLVVVELMLVLVALVPGVLGLGDVDVDVDVDGGGGVGAVVGTDAAAGADVVGNHGGDGLGDGRG